MSVKYDVYATPMPDENGETVYHVRVKNAGIVTTDELAKQIEYATSLTSGDVKAVFNSLNHLLITHLSSGKRIHIEGLGYFQLSVAAPVVKDPKHMRANHIEAKTIKFLPEKKVKQQLGSIQFERDIRKIHSQSLTMDDIIELLNQHFAEHSFITRAAFQELCGFTRATAIRRINELIQNGVLKADGVKGSPIYVLSTP